MHKTFQYIEIVCSCNIYWLSRLLPAHHAAVLPASVMIMTLWKQANGQCRWCYYNIITFPESHNVSISVILSASFFPFLYACTVCVPVAHVPYIHGSNAISRAVKTAWIYHPGVWSLQKKCTVLWSSVFGRSRRKSNKTRPIQTHFPPRSLRVQVCVCVCSRSYHRPLCTQWLVATRRPPHNIRTQCLYTTFDTGLIYYPSVYSVMYVYSLACRIIDTRPHTATVKLRIMKLDV